MNLLLRRIILILTPLRRHMGSSGNWIIMPPTFSMAPEFGRRVRWARKVLPDQLVLRARRETPVPQDRPEPLPRSPVRQVLPDRKAVPVPQDRPEPLPRSPVRQVLPDRKAVPVPPGSPVPWDLRAIPGRG